MLYELHTIELEREGISSSCRALTSESPKTETLTCGGNDKEIDEVWFLEQICEELLRTEMENAVIFLLWTLKVAGKAIKTRLKYRLGRAAG